LLGVSNTKGFIELIKTIGGFKSVDQIGISDAGRPVLKCQK